MSSKIIVHKGRTNVLAVSLGVDVSADTITSQIRSEPDQNSDLIATWTVAKVGGGTTGDLTLTLDDSTTVNIVANSGYMDLKRVKSGQPIPVFDKPIEIIFRGTVTS